MLGRLGRRRGESAILHRDLHCADLSAVVAIAQCGASSSLALHVPHIHADYAPRTGQPALERGGCCPCAFA